MDVDKSEIRGICEALVQQRMEPVQQAMEEAQSSANSETKSTAGDKHETSRAMAQGERDRLAQQLHNLQMLHAALMKIPLNSGKDTVEIGSYVKTSQGDFYVSVGLGEVKQGGMKFYAIGAHSPVGQQIMNKRQGDRFAFGPREAEIEKIY